MQSVFATCFRNSIERSYNNRYLGSHCHCISKLVGEKAVNNVKLNWMQREDADLYKIYRDGNCIGEAKGNTYDDYNLKADKTFTYHVEAFKEGKKIATSASQQATTFTPSGETKNL